MFLLVKYVSPIDKKVKTQLELLSLDATNCTAEKIFDTFKRFLKKNIPIQNIVGMASNNASVMTGCNYSFFRV